LFALDVHSAETLSLTVTAAQLVGVQKKKKTFQTPSERNSLLAQENNNHNELKLCNIPATERDAPATNDANRKYRGCGTKNL
jgi:hypothetical protein